MWIIALLEIIRHPYPLRDDIKKTVTQIEYSFILSLLSLIGVIYLVDLVYFSYDKMQLGLGTKKNNRHVKYFLALQAFMTESRLEPIGLSTVNISLNHCSFTFSLICTRTQHALSTSGNSSVS
jgi:hypothetical protein